MPGLPRGSNSVLINRGGVLIAPSTLFGTDLSSADASQLLKEGVDSFELPDAKKSCKACRKTHDTNMSSINALVNLISHNQLGTKLQYVDMSDIIDTNDFLFYKRFLNPVYQRQLYEIEEASEQTCDKQTSSDGLHTLAKRKASLEGGEMSGTVEPDRVWCKRCEKWIALHGLHGEKYFTRHWVNHCARSLHIDAALNQTIQYV